MTIIHKLSSKPALSILLTVSWMLLVGISPGVTQERKPARTITASGKGIVSIPTTLSQVRLAVEVQGKTPNNAQQEAAKLSARVMEYLKTQQVDKLQTTGINLNPTYIYPNNSKPQIIGYTASNSMQAKGTATLVVEQAAAAVPHEIADHERGFECIAPEARAIAAHHHVTGFHLEEQLA